MCTKEIWFSFQSAWNVNKTIVSNNKQKVKKVVH